MFQRHPNFVGVITVTLIIHISNDKKNCRSEAESSYRMEHPEPIRGKNARVGRDLSPRTSVYQSSPLPLTTYTTDWAYYTDW